MAYTPEEVKLRIERNQHIKNYPSQVIQSSYLHARDAKWKAEYEMKTTDKRTKRFKELQMIVAENDYIMPQLEEAHMRLTGRRIIKY